jgi:hypothetical protein
MDVRESIGSYDPSVAVGYGQIINVAYQMYGSAPANPMPTPPSNFPAGYRFVAWVQMKDFLLVRAPPETEAETRVRQCQLK